MYFNRHLEERDVLSRKVSYLEKIHLDKDEEIKILNRKVHLKTKNLNTQIINEQKKYRELAQKVHQQPDKRRFHSNESILSCANDFKANDYRVPMTLWMLE